MRINTPHAWVGVHFLGGWIVFVLVFARLGFFMWNLFRLWLKKSVQPSKVLRFRNPENAKTGEAKHSSRTMRRPAVIIVLGSGGHTTEMLYILRGLGQRESCSIHYVVTQKDRGSACALRTFYADLRSTGGSETTPLHHPHSRTSPPASKLPPLCDTPKYHMHTLSCPRSGRQGYIRSIGQTCYALFQALYLVYGVRPTLLLMNGPGLCVPLTLACRFLRCIGLRCRLIYMESLTCVTRLSLTGKIVYRFVDDFLVSWNSLHRKYPHTLYVNALKPREVNGGKLIAGRLHENALHSTEPYALITVGTTCFDALLEACDQAWFVDFFRTQFGAQRIFMQRGTGSYMPHHPQIEPFRFQEKGFHKMLAQASVVVGHAGVGTILDTMQGQAYLILVPNEALRDNHQLQLAQALSSKRVATMVRLEQLKPQLLKFKKKNASKTPYP